LFDEEKNIIAFGRKKKKIGPLFWGEKTEELKRLRKKFFTRGLNGGGGGDELQTIFLPWQKYSPPDSETGVPGTPGGWGGGGGSLQ